MEHLLRLLLDGSNHLGNLVARHRRHDPAKEVEVPVALRIPDVATLTIDQRDRLAVVQGPTMTEGSLGAGRVAPRVRPSRHHEIAVCVRATVAIEGPGLANSVDHIEI